MAVISPNDERVIEGFQNAESESQFWREHQDELTATHPDQFVAVHDGRVVATALDLQQLLAAVRAKGLDSSHVWVRFMATQPRLMIL